MTQQIDKINKLIKLTERVNKLAQKDNMSFENKCYQLRQSYILAQQFKKAKMFGNILNTIHYIRNNTYDYFHQCCLNAIEQIKEEKQYGDTGETTFSIIDHENMVLILTIFE